MIIILMGVSCSGKTAIGKQLSKELDWPFYDGDDFHSPANIKKMRAAAPLTDEDRLPWLITLSDMIKKHVEMDEHMVLACSALKDSYRKELNVSPTCHFVFLKGSFELIKKRMEKRKGHFFHPELLQSQFDTLQEPTDCLIVDIDKTIPEIIKTMREKLNI